MSTTTLNRIGKLNKLERSKTGRYRLKKMDLGDRLTYGVFLIFILTLIYFLLFEVEYKWELMSISTAGRLASEFFRFNLVPFAEQTKAISLLVNTVLLGFITTIIGAILGLPFGLLAARNISSIKVCNLIRAIASFIRAVPTIIWVLLFISGYGLSATTAVVGMTFHSWAFFVKSYSEAFEEVDLGTIEALKATGATKIQIILNAIIPTATTKMISWLALRSEINFSVAVVIGPAVGVPGMIGTMINGYSRVGNYSGLGFSVFCVITTAFVFEICINKIRYRTMG